MRLGAVDGHADLAFMPNQECRKRARIATDSLRSVDQAYPCFGFQPLPCATVAAAATALCETMSSTPFDAPPIPPQAHNLSSEADNRTFRLEASMSTRSALKLAAPAPIMSRRAVRLPAS